MTQQQKQRERPTHASRTAGELMIATLDLLLGLPLACLVLVVMREPTNAHDLRAWLMIAPLIVIALGLTTAGVLVSLRQCRLARAAQWFAALGGILLWEGYCSVRH